MGIPHNFPNLRDNQYWGADRRDLAVSVFYTESYIDDVEEWFKTKTPKYLVLGKRWFARTYGNTYHTVKIVDLATGETIFQSERSYGYGNQWKTTAYDWLIKQGLASDGDRHNHELNRERFIYEVVDVPRRKDL